MDAIFDLARMVVNTRYEDIPDPAKAAAKEHILDTLGCCLAGSALPECARLVEQIQEWGGRGESTIIAYGDKVPAPMAGCGSDVDELRRRLNQIRIILSSTAAGILSLNRYGCQKEHNQQAERYD